MQWKWAQNTPQLISEYLKFKKFAHGCGSHTHQFIGLARPASLLENIFLYMPLRAAVHINTWVYNCMSVCVVVIAITVLEAICDTTESIYYWAYLLLLCTLGVEFIWGFGWIGTGWIHSWTIGLLPGRRMRLYWHCLRWWRVGGRKRARMSAGSWSYFCHVRS